MDMLRGELLANPDAVSYIRQYKNQYSLQSLKQALQQQGYSPAEIEEAVREAISPPKPIPVAPKPSMVPRAPPPVPQSAPAAPFKKSNTWIIVVVVLLLLLPLLLVGCLIAIPMMFFAGTTASMYHYLPFLTFLGKGSSSTYAPTSVDYGQNTLNRPENPLSEVNSAEAVAFHTLIQALPAQSVDGYLPGKPEGGSVAFPTGEGTSMKYSSASNTYTASPQESVKVSILDTVGIESLTFMYGSFFGVEYESSDGYRRKTTIQGYPAWETYDAKTGKSSLAVAVKNRIYVTLDPYEESKVPVQVLQDLVNQVNYGLLASSIP